MATNGTFDVTAAKRPNPGRFLARIHEQRAQGSNQEEAAEEHHRLQIAARDDMRARPQP
jgi:hypothetical protein